MIKATHLALVLTLGLGLQAVTLAAKSAQQAAADTEARRVTAENSIRQLQRASSPSDVVKAAYGMAAERNNAWLNAACTSLQAGTESGPDTSLATAAAGALVEWVIARNAALGVDSSALVGASADGVRKSIAQDLETVADSALSANRRASEAKRADAVKALRARFAWKSWDEVR